MRGVISHHPQGASQAKESTPEQRKHLTSRSPTLDRSRLLALGWAAFVACSWTWCIGMYLPVLMVRDFGPLGWLVFPVPNGVGAAARGWILHRPGAAANLARRHWAAAACFSIVTILFHA